MIKNITGHTADIGIKGKAKNLKLLFKKCAVKIIKLALRKSTNKNKLRKVYVIVKNKTGLYEDLLHDFLNEIIFFIFVKKKHPLRIKIKNFSVDEIKAEILFKNIEETKILRELKSVTYHNLNIKKTKHNYIAEFIIDT